MKTLYYIIFGFLVVSLLFIQFSCSTNSSKSSEISLKEFSFNCFGAKKDDPSRIQTENFIVEHFHLQGDPENTNRIKITNGEFNFEILPSKGFSVGEAFYKDRPLFWVPPCDMPDVDKLDLIGKEVAINGKVREGITFLKTFMGGIELYGIQNWGMRFYDEEEKLFPLHGETSNTPVKIVEGKIFKDSLVISGSFIARTYDGDSNKVWHQRGDSLFKLTRTITIIHTEPEIKLKDEFQNISKEERIPDLGYHVTFFPEKGAQLLIPNKTIENRGGGKIPEIWDTWPPSDNPSVRTEVGVIRKGLLLSDNILNGKQGVQSIIIYPDSTGISVTTPYMPYYQSWNCSGGAGNKEFSDVDGNSIITRNWDGLGVEFGSSALDNNGNIDPEFKGDFNLKPGESVEIEVIVKVHEKAEAKNIAKTINNYNKNIVVLNE